MDNIKETKKSEIKIEDILKNNLLILSDLLNNNKDVKNNPEYINRKQEVELFLRQKNICLQKFYIDLIVTILQIQWKDVDIYYNLIERKNEWISFKELNILLNK